MAPEREWWDEYPELEVVVPRKEPSRLEQLKEINTKLEKLEKILIQLPEMS